VPGEQEVTVGVVGTGAMGSAMAQCLLAAGRPLLVHNRTRERARAVEDAGAAWAGSPRELAERCTVVLGCLRDTRAVEEVYLGPDGLLARARPGQVFVEHGTFSPQVARAAAAEADARGAAFLDAPVTGGPEGARRGTLAVMAGGQAWAIDAVETVLAAYAASVVRVGPAGRGLELKLVNQLLVSVHMAAAGEAVALIRALGLDAGVSSRVLTGGWAGSVMLARAFAQLEAGELTGTGATVAGVTEVQELVARLVGAAALPAPVFGAARARFDVAMDTGLGEHDPAALACLGSQERPCERRRE
jgi:3-hydroxyisobutyrate dehydrogenase-like beta-hydroxyacid dehydrogenase